MDNHRAQILDQFTRQAEPFVHRHGGKDEALLELLYECCGAGCERARVLDVACGPGIVSCFFAARGHTVMGLDLVPAMLNRARKLEREKQVAGVDWQRGEAAALPYADGVFDIALTRFSFHHFADPLGVLREMKRVCRSGGVIAVCDVTPAPETQDSFNHWEKLRDPSHSRAFTRRELEEMAASAGLVLLRQESYELDMALEDLLSGSFPNAGNEEKIRLLFEEEIRRGDGALGVDAYRRDGGVRLTYPVTVSAWRR